VYLELVDFEPAPSAFALSRAQRVEQPDADES
jgi:hypothetical protein